MKHLLFLSLVSFLLISCDNNKLTNDEAMVILKKNYKENCSGVVKRIIGLSKKSKTLDGRNIYNLWKEMEQEGLIKVKESSYSATVWFDLTNNTKNKLNGDEGNDYTSIIMAEYEVEKINGISQGSDKNIVTANFTVKKNYNSFYKIRVGDKLNCKSSEKANERTIELIKYDTGWKIKKYTP